MAKKKKAVEPLGSYTPNKADVEAYAEGKLTAKAKRLDRIVDAAFAAYRIMLKAQEVFERKMEKLEKLLPDDGSHTVRSIDQKRQVKFQRYATKRGNQNALEAKALIDEYIENALKGKGKNPDEKAMIQMLKNVITESRGRILLTGPMVQFRRMQFEDPILKKAQRLLGDAFDVSETKQAYYIQILRESDNAWVKAVLGKNGELEAA